MEQRIEQSQINSEIPMKILGQTEHEGQKLSYEEKCQVLHKLMKEYSRQPIVVAFSGGADSSLLLKLAALHCRDRGNQVIAITVSTELHPVKDEEIARKVACEEGTEHRVLKIRELENPQIEKNPVDRCYHCKKFLFRAIKKEAENAGTQTVLEGTNADDLLQYRPGLRALQELEIKSPLKEAGLTKDEVRKLSKEYGISVADRPSSPCLATRFPYGDKLTIEKLNQVEQGEIYLKSLGLYNVRLRIHGTIARIEVDTADIEKLLNHREQIIHHLKSLGYGYITLDLEGFRSGSMDEPLLKQRIKD